MATQKISGLRIVEDGPRTVPAIEISNNVIVSETYPKSTWEWLLQHPAVRRRRRVRSWVKS